MANWITRAIGPRRVKTEYACCVCVCDCAGVCICVVCDSAASPCYSWNHELNVDKDSCIGGFDMRIEMDLEVLNGEVICNPMHTVQQTVEGEGGMKW